jgi:tRNA(adenine34) deaminase
MMDSMERRGSGPTMDDPSYMRLALAEAARAMAHDDVPVGCVVVDATAGVLGVGENRREIDGDPTAHAEIVAVRRAAERRGHWRLDGCTLFVTLEPCAMCAGAIVNARIARVVFAASDPKAGAIASQFGIGVDDRLNHRFVWDGGVLGAEAVELLQCFFRRLRAEGQK